MPSGIFCVLDARRNLGDRYTCVCVPFSINYILITRECTVREIRGNFFYADSAAHPVIRSGYFSFFRHFGIVSLAANRSVILQYSNVEKGRRALFFAARETAARAIRHVMKTPSRNLYDFASSFVERVTRIYILSFRSCVHATWRLWD